jgi:protein required for attachment to host cells
VKAALLAAQEDLLMKPTWILVADGSRGRLFEKSHSDAALLPLQAWVHPPSRLRAESLAYDQLGRAGKGHTGTVSFAPRTSLKQREHQRFAQEMARHLTDGVSAGRCGELVLIASNSMLGAIRQHLTAQAAKRVSWSAPVDLTPFEGRELESRIDALRLARATAAPAAALESVMLEEPASRAVAAP